MAGRILLSVIVACLSVSSASAFNGRFGLWRPPAPPTVTHYYVAPLYYCLPTAPQVIPVPDASPFARPTPAPPSSTKEPPLQKMSQKTPDDPRMPVIITAHAGTVATKPAERCKVGFWNLSGRDVVLTIDGKAMKLAKDRAVTLDLDREFVWQVEGQPQHVERVLPTLATHEVVIRE